MKYSGIRARGREGGGPLRGYQSNQVSWDVVGDREVRLCVLKIGGGVAELVALSLSVLSNSCLYVVAACEASAREGGIQLDAQI